MISLNELRPVPVISGLIVVFLAIASVGVENEIFRLKLGEMALFFMVIFFHSLLKEDIEKLERKLEGD